MALLGKEKIIPQRSEVWAHFTKIINSEGASKTKCNYCEKEFYCDMKKYGTGSLKYHISSYLIKKHVGKG
ncbi:hypothetical protein Goklo_028090 [Gossypium klotzschianum]|uniref:BED-type domain-containing protein n=1 Tax=Gossypium klotzschianum TaxID=34286 RepID=A0A7J8U0N9_9ROSI|nr:hypothetical protein [Gossypium klotzschianum]